MPDFDASGYDAEQLQHILTTYALARRNPKGRPWPAISAGPVGDPWYVNTYNVLERYNGGPVTFNDRKNDYQQVSSMVHSTCRRADGPFMRRR